MWPEWSRGTAVAGLKLVGARTIVRTGFRLPSVPWKGQADTAQAGWTCLAEGTLKKCASFQGHGGARAVSTSQLAPLGCFVGGNDAK